MSIYTLVTMFMKYLNRPHNLIHYNFFTFNRNYLEYVGFSKILETGEKNIEKNYSQEKWDRKTKKEDMEKFKIFYLKN